MTNTETFRKVRLWFYSAAVAAGPLVTFYGLMDTNEYALWLGLGATLLAVPVGTTAIANINPKPDPEVIVVADPDVVVETETPEETEEPK